MTKNIRSHLILIWSLILFPVITYAEYCIETTQSCVEGPATKIIDGFEIHKDCWKYEVQYRCYKDNHTDYCKGISSTAGCELIESTCEDQGKDGICNKLKYTFKCGNLLAAATGNTLLDSHYTITRDELVTKDCDPSFKHKDCHEVGQTCIEGAETRNINGKDVYKDCWKYESKFTCFVGSHISNCQEYEKECKLLSANCLSTNRDNQCRHTEKKFLCGEILGKKPVLMQCQGAQYCIGDNCEQIKYQANNNMGKAISSLSAIRNLKDDLDVESCKSGEAGVCKIFNGQNQSCRINPVNARNCCKDKGWLNDLKLTQCNENEKLLGHGKEKGLCHEVGSYCSKKIKPLNICIEYKRSYCCFQSRLARIIHEQGRSQLGINWGSAEAPNCAPLTIEQLQKLDFSKIDFREFYGEAFSKMNGSKQSFSPVSSESLKGKVAEINKVSEAFTGSEYQDEIARRIKEHYGQ